MKIRKGLLWGLSPVYILLFGELFLRLFDPVPMLPRYVKAMPYGIRGNSENMTYKHRTAEYEIEIRTNSKGIRADREFPYKKPEGVKRIVLLGDSFGMGYGVSLEDSFSELVANELTERLGQTVEMINLSTSGHGNAEELIVLKEEGFKYEPDLVLLSWHASDLGDNVRSGLYKLEEGKLVRAAREYLPAIKTREFLFSFSAYRFLVAHSHVYTFLREDAARFVKWVALMVSPVATGSDEQGVAESRERLTLALLSEIDSACVENRASFAVLDIPVRRSRTEFVSAFPGEVSALPYRICSPLSLFYEHADGEKLYWERSHGHFTPLGCKIVADTAVEHIYSLGILSGF